MYHRYLQLFNTGQILVIKTSLYSSNRCKNLTILIKINSPLLYACNLAQEIEETSERPDTGTDIMSSIPYVNGGTLLFSASSKYLRRRQSFYVSFCLFRRASEVMFYTFLDLPNFLSLQILCFSSHGIQFQKFKTVSKQPSIYKQIMKENQKYVQSFMITYSNKFFFIQTSKIRPT